MQAQINPHFLFNVLNTIGRLALLEGADKTRNDLCIFGYDALHPEKEKNNVVTLKKKWNTYRIIYRFKKCVLGNRLNYSVEVDEMAEDILCPLMTIQPFVENAIIHAIEPNAGAERYE